MTMKARRCSCKASERLDCVRWCAHGRRKKAGNPVTTGTGRTASPGGEEVEEGEVERSRPSWIRNPERSRDWHRWTERTGSGLCLKCAPETRQWVSVRLLLRALRMAEPGRTSPSWRASSVSVAVGICSQDAPSCAARGVSWPRR